MKKFILPLLLTGLLLSAPKTFPKPSKIHQQKINQAKKYLEEFNKWANYKNKTYTSTIHILPSLGGGAVGICILGTNTILLDAFYMTHMMSLERYTVIAHEIGHCAKRWMHTNTKFKDGCPDHIMWPQVIGSFCLVKHWEIYEKQIFEALDDK